MPTGGLAQVVEVFNAAVDAELCVQEGVNNLSKAVLKEFEPASWILGACYFYGVCVERDFVMAKNLLRQASASDDETVEKGAEAALENWEEKVEKMETAAKSLEEDLVNFEESLDWEGEEPGETDSTEKTSDEGNAPGVAS
ncbi:MAG: SEL1-like repeat protein [Thermoguttaceae bacterium]|nr:SEL1-like repeat protein [Thermoguttaceae bacterium]